MYNSVDYIVGRLIDIFRYRGQYPSHHQTKRLSHLWPEDGAIVQFTISKRRTRANGKHKKKVHFYHYLFLKRMTQGWIAKSPNDNMIIKKRGER